MKVFILVLVVISALTVIGSGVWVAAALIHAICPPHAARPELDARNPPDDISGS
jgi:hypothetical protein